MVRLVRSDLRFRLRESVPCLSLHEDRHEVADVGVVEGVVHFRHHPSDLRSGERSEAIRETVCDLPNGLDLVLRDSPLAGSGDLSAGVSEGLRRVGPGVDPHPMIVRPYRQSVIGR